MAEKINVVRTQTPNEAKASVRKCFKINRPLFMWGPPGIGKSDIVHQIGAEQGREVIDVRLSLWDPTDIKGIPFYNPSANSMTWAPPVELPQDPDSTAILFLDELNSAAPATQAAAYQLILNRRVGNYKLPKGVSIVAAGNRDSDKGVTYRMPTPLANRFIHIELKHSFDDWQEWAILNGIHPQVISYVAFAKQDLYDFNPKSASRAFATPRSWAFVSDLLQGNDLTQSQLSDLVAGSVGDGVAVKFMAHREIASKMPNPLDILTGKVTSLQIKEISAAYSLAINMCYELRESKDSKTKDEFNSMLDNFFRFMTNNFPTEIVVMAAQVAISSYKIRVDPDAVESFEEFHTRFGKLIKIALVS